MARSIFGFVLTMLAALAGPARAQQSERPNILVIWGDDIGVHNVSAYNHGIMGYRTPNIDRLAKEGLIHRRLCAAVMHRRPCVIHSRQNPFRTGLLTIGMPGSEHGIPDWAPTIADLLSIGLHHRPVRQEPSRRPGYAPADGARVRRVLR